MQNLFFPLLLMLPFAGNIAAADDPSVPAVFIEGKGNEGFSVLLLKEYGEVRREIVQHLSCKDFSSYPDPLRKVKVFTCDEREFFFDKAANAYVFRDLIDRTSVSSSIAR